MSEGIDTLFHPLANLFPLIEGAGFDDLVADIAANGLHEKIVMHEGRILDGRNRYRAGIAAGLFCRGDIEEWCEGMCIARAFLPEEDGDPLAFVLSRNLHRRHLTTSQRAMVAAQIGRLGHGGDRSKTPNDALNREARAAQLSVGPKSVERAEQVVDHGAPELREAVTQGHVSVAAAAEISRLTLDQQRELIREMDPAVVSRVVAEQRAGRNVEKKARRAAREVDLADKIEAGNTALEQARVSGKRYGVILADPEWRFEVYSRETGMDRAADNHYPTSPTEAIAARPVAEIAARDCVLFLWATAPMLPDALKVMAAWGFAYKSHVVWRKAVISGADMNDDKRDRGGYSTGVVLGTGYWFRNCHELLLIGTRGDVPCPAMGLQFPSMIDAAPLRHSEKPARFHELIESYFPNLPKIELNARAARPGWDLWGAEAPEPEADTDTRQEATPVPGDLDTILSPGECRNRREALGLNVAALARHAAMADSTIKKFEAGRSQRAGWRVLLRDALARLETGGAEAPGGG